MRLPLLAALAISLACAGCDSTDTGSPETTGALDVGAPASLGSVGPTASFNGHTVTFKGAAYADGATTFTYEVTSVEPGPPALDWFFLENACGAAPVALQPDNAVGPAEVDGVPGVKWNASLKPGTSRTYSYAFAGDLPVRVARTAIQRGGVVETAAVPGPCGGHYVRGSVFVNADADAARSGSELGLPDVVVEVYDGSGLVSTDVTAAGGAYEFLLPGGAYTLRVPTAAEGAFNGALYGSYAPVGGAAPAELALALTADVGGRDFGFDPDKEKIVADLSEGGAYQTRAQDVKFWQGVVRNASRGRATADPYGGEITPGELAGYLGAIFSAAGESGEGYYLLRDPFVLAGSDPLAAAADLLSRPTKTDAEKVARNLFAMELNLMRGWGTPDRDYDDALMSYLEEWVRARGGAVGAGATGPDSGALSLDGGGGGGTVEEQITLSYLGGGGGGTVE